MHCLQCLWSCVLVSFFSLVFFPSDGFTLDLSLLSSLLFLPLLSLLPVIFLSFTLVDAMTLFLSFISCLFFLFLVHHELFIYWEKNRKDRRYKQSEKRRKKMGNLSFFFLPLPVSLILLYSLCHTIRSVFMFLSFSLYPVIPDSFFSKKVHKTLLQRLIYQHFFLPTEQSSRTFGSEWCLTLSWHGFVSWGQRPF